MTGPEGTLPAGVRPLIATDPPVVGEYPLLGRLGSGGMGVVYLGHHPDHGLVAVKVLRSSYADESQGGHGAWTRSSGTDSWQPLDPSRPWDRAERWEPRGPRPAGVASAGVTAGPAAGPADGSADGSAGGPAGSGSGTVLTTTEELRRRFRAEADYARRVASCATARVIEDGTATVRPYIVTEYIQGPALHEVVGRQGPLPDGTLEAVALGVTAALAAIHRAGLVHRDLKPANVLLARTGPRVIDFGLAAEADISGGPTRLGMVMGSTGWIAPERLAGQPATAASDMFGWGCLVAYAGTGRHPFGGGSEDEITERVMHGAADLEGLVPALRAPVAATLAKDPRLRPQAGDLLRTLLIPLLDGRPPAPGDDLERIAATLIAKIWRPPADLADAPAAWPQATVRENVSDTALMTGTIGTAGLTGGSALEGGAGLGPGGPGSPGPGAKSAVPPPPVVRGRHTRHREAPGRAGAFGWAAAGWTAAAVVLVAGMAYGLDAARGDNDHESPAPAVVSPADPNGPAAPGTTGIDKGAGPGGRSRSPRTSTASPVPKRSTTPRPAPEPTTAPAPTETTSPAPAPAPPGKVGRTKRPGPKKTPVVFGTG